MKFLERYIRYTSLSDEEIIAENQKWEDLETKLGGFPKKRMYRAWFSNETTGTYVYEREWDSLAAYEEAYNRLYQSPEVAKLIEEILDPQPARQEIYYTIGE